MSNDKKQKVKTFVSVFVWPRCCHGDRGMM